MKEDCGKKSKIENSSKKILTKADDSRSITNNNSQLKSKISYSQLKTKTKDISYNKLGSSYSQNRTKDRTSVEKSMLR